MTRDLALLRSLVARDAGAVRDVLGDPATDLPGFFGFARRHQLGSFCYRALQELGLAKGLPPPLLAAAKAASLLERTLSERLMDQLRELGELFERGAVPVLFMKGPLFAKRYYGSLEARSVSDLDILVQGPPDLARVERLLLEVGFAPAFRIPLSRRLARLFAHHFEYRRDSLPLDVHWALQRHFSFAIDYGRVWSTAAQVELAGRTFPATSDEYEIVLQILGVVTDLQVGKLTLRPLVDLVHALRAVDGTMVWREFFAARERERILRPSAYVLALTLDAMGCRERFPELGSALAPTLQALPPTALAGDALLASRPLDVKQKLLALRIYEGPLVASLAWWVVSLPFRMAVYGVRQG
jgi:Uncharacterised nucleotidyltransferase